MHRMFLVGQRRESGTDAGRVDRDDEGRWSPAPSEEASGPARREVWGFVGTPRASEVPAGAAHDAAAQLPAETIVSLEDDLVVSAGLPLLDGRYEIVALQPGRAVVRLILRRTA